MRGARIREKLASGGVVFNVRVGFPSPTVVEMLALSGVDYVMLDAEHGAFGERDCEDMVRAADLVDVPAIVRVPHNDAPTILRYLDLGASGIIAPHISSVDDARRAVAAARYAPEGQRSFGTPRASRYGARESAADYARRANREVMVIGLFEDAAALEQVDDIFAVEGLDALGIGPSDLAFSMGHGGQTGHPEVQAVIDQIIAAARRAGKATSLPATSLEQARANVARGCRIISCGVGDLIMPGARALVAGLAST